MNLFWFRRDLRLNDNPGLNSALMAEGITLPIFIFDENILSELPPNDARISFIYKQLEKINKQLQTFGSGILILKGEPVSVIDDLINKYPIRKVFFNRDYEPYGLKRDKEIEKKLSARGIEIKNCKDHLIFEPHEVLKADKSPYTIYTPYKKLWYNYFNTKNINVTQLTRAERFYQKNFRFPSIQELGFKESTIQVRPYNLSVVDSYHSLRDIPSLDATSYLGPHLRFGTISIRQVIQKLDMKFGENNSFLNELIWREFFIQILYHFPHVIDQNFRAKYNGIQWRNNEEDFKSWCEGETGYPVVDAGMRQLNQTGFMHNRVRMITAGFLCKHLLIDWRWGEAYFAQKLLDYELASNNGNWQWAAGTGCDAAPYFRVFNPTEQHKKFDPEHAYIKKWVPEYDTPDYPKEIVEHKFARQRAIEQYKMGIEKSN